MIDLEDYNWIDVEKDLWPQAYESEAGHLIYIEDTYRNKHPYNQTTIDDWNDSRYNLILKRPYNPNLDILHESDDWNEVEAYLEAITGDFE